MSKKLIFILSFVFSVFFSMQAFAGLESLPVQDGGRVKPYDTFAREMLQLIYGKETYKAKEAKKAIAATDVVFSWMLIPEEWENTEFILIRHSGLREALKLPNDRLYYKPSEIMANDHLGLLIQELKNKHAAEEKIDPFFQAVQTLENQISAFHAVRLGVALRVLPQNGNSAWKNVTELDGEFKEKFQGITQAFINHASAEAAHDSSKSKDAHEKLDEAVQTFVKSIEAQFGDYSNATKMKVENIYIQNHPFGWAWKLYLAALVMFSFSYFGKKEIWGKIAWPLLGGGAIFHVWGFISRIYILERPPVSNMFETVVWVAFICLIFSLIIYRMNRSKIIPLAASMVATLSLILCDVSSSVLDSTLTPLEPVLRDNFWLSTHVLIIVSSYAAFFLAFFIGDILLYYYLKDEKKYQDKIAAGSQAIYRAIQIGVVLLATGIILGGVWADYSWGRFWGWDPKETWAFIALLGYVIILHGRVAGWLKNFGITAASVIGFSLVIMSWYGVNFVLGAGLHTYGFGAGGVEYVSAFVAAHLLFVAFVTTLRQSRL